MALQIKNGTFDPESQWRAKWKRLHAEHPEFSEEAYSFVQKAMIQHDFTTNAPAPQGSRSISHRIEDCQTYAKRFYGESAKALLESWGIKTFLDVGEIFILITSEGTRGLREPALEIQLRSLHEKMRESLRQKYGQSPFLPDP